MKIRFLALALSALTASAVAQTGNTDQTNTANDNVGYNMQFFSDMQQVVPITTTGQFEGIKIRMATNNAAVGLPVAIFLGAGPFAPSTSPIWSDTAYAAAGGQKDVFVDATAAGLYFQSGETITIRIGDGVSGVAGTSLFGNSGWPNAYYPHPFYEDGAAQTLSRLWFETWFLPCAGSAVSYGAGCAGSGTHVPQLSMIGCPVASSQVVLEISNALGGSSALLVFGLTQANTPIGASGCSLLVGSPFSFTPSVPLAGSGPANGSIMLPGLLPSDASGVSLTIQAWVIDPGSQAGAAGTNGLALSIG